MKPDELDVDPDKDMAKASVRISQLGWVLLFAAFTAAVWIISWLSGQPWLSHSAPWIIVAFVYVMERQFFVGRMYELNERLRRIEHKVNALRCSAEEKA